MSVVHLRPSTVSNDFSSETTGSIVTTCNSYIPFCTKEKSGGRYKYNSAPTLRLDQGISVSYKNVLVDRFKSCKSNYLILFLKPNYFIAGEIYTSESTGSDESGEGTAEKPFKTVLQVNSAPDKEKQG